jgi:hydrogenase 3 maturation protease
MKELVLGIGNTLKGDDGIGIYIAEKLNKYAKGIRAKSKQAQSAVTGREVVAISCGTTPENYTSIIRKGKPDTLILVDAADMGLAPGSYRIIPPEKIEIVHFSTHNMSLSFLISYLRESCGEITLIGIQPDRMDVGTALSKVVQKSGDQVASLIIKRRLNEIKSLEG